MSLRNISLLFIIENLRGSPLCSVEKASLGQEAFLCGDLFSLTYLIFLYKCDSAVFPIW